MTEEEKILISWASEGTAAQMEIHSKGFSRELQIAQLKMNDEATMLVRHANLSPLELGRELERLVEQGAKTSKEGKEALVGYKKTKIAMKLKRTKERILGKLTSIKFQYIAFWGMLFPAKAKKIEPKKVNKLKKVK